MRRLLSHAAFATTLLAMPGAAAARTEAPVANTWQPPACRRVVGTPAVTYTADEGATLASLTLRSRDTFYTRGLVALDAPNVLLAVQNRTLLRSDNAGCRWTSLGSIPSPTDSFPLSLAAAPGERAYAWADNREDLARLDGTQVTMLFAPVSSIIGVGADRTNGDVVRLAGRDGSVWESTDAGGRWSLLGRPPANAGVLFAYRAAFNPADLDHILIGTAVAGAFVTYDGAQSWSPVDAIAFSPADPSFLYLGLAQ